MFIQTKISPLQPADFPRAAAVWEASVRATHHFVSEADILYFRQIVREALPQLEQTACMRDINDQVIGFTVVVDRKVEMLFIHPDWRSRGIGKKLLNFAVNEFGATTLDVNEQNEQAVGFYRHMGFEVTGRSALDGTGKPYPLLHMRLGAYQFCRRR
jgi:putative acetyltransferase